MHKVHDDAYPHWQYVHALVVRGHGNHHAAPSPKVSHTVIRRRRAHRSLTLLHTCTHQKRKKEQSANITIQPIRKLNRTFLTRYHKLQTDTTNIHIDHFKALAKKNVHSYTHKKQRSEKKHSPQQQLILRRGGGKTHTRKRKHSESTSLTGHDILFTPTTQTLTRLLDTYTDIIFQAYFSKPRQSGKTQTAKAM